ncbi:MAG TPA: isoprenylcysteine carboxylmethyltransferase family protein [Anaerolineaceae bacterium]
MMLILLAMLVYGVLHSLLASLRAKALAERWFGQGFRRFYRLFFSIFAVVTFLPVLALVALLPTSQIYAIPFPWVVLTGLLQAGGLVVLLAGVWQTGALEFIGIRQLFESGFSQPPPERRLVTNGLYRWVRHPLYTGSLVFLWLTPMMTWNLLALNLGMTAYFWIGSIFEERRLVIEFGEAYHQYCQNTPAFIPRLNRRR